LDLLAAGPERRRRAKALQVMGYTYDEIGDLIGLGHTRVGMIQGWAAAVAPGRACGAFGGWIGCSCPSADTFVRGGPEVLRSPDR
jgi:hypothetical protein